MTSARLKIMPVIASNDEPIEIAPPEILILDVFFSVCSINSWTELQRLFSKLKISLWTNDLQILESVWQNLHVYVDVHRFLGRKFLEIHLKILLRKPWQMLHPIFWLVPMPLPHKCRILKINRRLDRELLVHFLSVIDVKTLTVGFAEHRFRFISSFRGLIGNYFNSCRFRWHMNYSTTWWLVLFVYFIKQPLFILNHNNPR